MKTRITELLGIKYPIFLGGMAWVSDGALAAAVSNGGGLGLIAAGGAGPDYVREQIAICRRMTDKPFGVNLMLKSPFAAEVAELLAEERISVITTGAGTPKPYLPLWLDAGCKVIPVIASVAMAEKVTAMGVSAVVAEGLEAGGHIGEVTTMALLPQIRDATHLPVIAAGGIADGRQAAAAFLLGADGLQIGTRFVAAEECSVHRVFKEKVLAAIDTDTTVTGKRLGSPVRSLKTPFTLKFAAAEDDSSVPKEKLEEMGTGSLRRAAVDGDELEGSFQVGQVASMVKKEQPAAEIIQEIFVEMQAALRDASRLID